jgi:flagellar motor switch protein FliG
MGVYTRFKRNPEGLRQLVELLESTPTSRRQKMIDVGMQEDAEYTKKALQYLMTFEDVMKLPDMELSEVLSETPARFSGLAIYKASDEIKARFLAKAQPRIASEIKEVLETPNVTISQIGGGQMKMIETTRKLEKRGLIKTKRVPS